VNYRVTATGGLNIRSGPGTDFEDVGDLPFNEIVNSPDTNGWVPILVADEDGAESVAWASAKYLVEDVGVEDPVAPAEPQGKITGKSVVAKAMTQAGDPYIFGYEVNLTDPNPKAFDCSELVQWVCAQLGVTPTMPDGAIYQRDHCQKYGTMITMTKAVKTAGALLFRIQANGSNHVVISRGDGSTIEAKGSAYGVGVFTLNTSNFTHAALIPGVQYT